MHAHRNTHARARRGRGELAQPGESSQVQRVGGNQKKKAKRGPIYLSSHFASESPSWLGLPSFNLPTPTAVTTAVSQRDLAKKFFKKNARSTSWGLLLGSCPTYLPSSSPSDQGPHAPPQKKKFPRTLQQSSRRAGQREEEKEEEGSRQRGAWAHHPP